MGLCVCHGRVVGASSGDSAALLVSSGKAKELTAGQQKNPPVGCGAAVGVPFAAGIDPNLGVLVMSDGVWKYVGWERVIEAASRASGARVIEALQDSAPPRKWSFPGRLYGCNA